MVKLTLHQKKILDALLTKTPKVVAAEFGLEVTACYQALHKLRFKIQNAEEFLSATKSKYRDLLKRRLLTPDVMPSDDNY